jgi:tRNA A37 threonylcarbamoyladenosine modification protein TsaB
LLVAVVDARRGEVYSVIYAAGTVLEERRPARVSSPETLAAELAGLTGRPLAVGDGAWRYRDLLAAAADVAGPADALPSPLVVAEIGSTRMTASLPEPVYLRQADVRIGWEEIGGRVSGVGAPAPGAPPATASGAVRPKLGP